MVHAEVEEIWVQGARDLFCCLMSRTKGAEDVGGPPGLRDGEWFDDDNDDPTRADDPVI
jgi:hypothetical protein